MAKNVTIAGAAYSAVPSIDVPQTGGGTASFFDVSDTTATASDVAQGKVFYAADGTQTTGTASGGGGGTITQDQDGYIVISESGGTTVLQSKSVTPSESVQDVTADTGYGGLSQVRVGAISSTYVGSGVTRRAAATITPGTSNQTIAAATYLTGAQTIAGDADLVASNIKQGVNIFGVTGTFSGGGGGTPGIVSITIDVSALSGGDYLFDIAGTQLDGNGLTYFTDQIGGNNATTTFDAVIGTNVIIATANSPDSWWCITDNGNVEEIYLTSNYYCGCVSGADTIYIEV